MSDERFSNLVLMLNGHKLRTDSVSISDVAQEFVSSNEDRKRNFGTADNFTKRSNLRRVYLTYWLYWIP